MTEQIQTEQTEQTGMEIMLPHLSPANRKHMEHYMRQPNDRQAYDTALSIAVAFDDRCGNMNAVGITAVADYYTNHQEKQRELQKRLNKKKASKIEFIDVSLLPSRRNHTAPLTRRRQEPKRPRPQVFRRPRGEHALIEDLERHADMEMEQAAELEAAIRGEQQ